MTNTAQNTSDANTNSQPWPVRATAQNLVDSLLVDLAFCFRSTRKFRTKAALATYRERKTSAVVKLLEALEVTPQSSPDWYVLAEAVKLIVGPDFEA